MLIRIFALGALIFSLLSCETRTSESIDTYIDHPLGGDTTCINAVAQAEEDVKHGKIKFFVSISLSSPVFRQEKYARELCAQHHLIFGYYPFSDIIIDIQRDGCYEAVMDRVIAQKYGPAFKKTLVQKADSMLLASHDTVWSYMCEKEPKLINKPENLYIKTDSILRSKLHPDKDGDLPYMDVRYIIDTTGRVPGYYLIEQLYNFGSKENELYKPQMLAMAISGLGRFKKGIPGEINGRKFVTFNMIRVVFK